MGCDMTSHYELVYVSKCVDGVTNDQIIDLILQGRSRNLYLGVTGLLIYANGRFYQWLEGTKSNVLDVYGSILKDKRHYDVRMVSDNFLGVPLFNGSRLRVVTNNEEIHRNILNDVSHLDPVHEKGLSDDAIEVINVLAKYSF